jgi:transposase
LDAQGSSSLIMKKQTTSQFVIGVDLGDTKHTICVTDKQGIILKEFSFPNSRKHLLQLAADYPQALVALEVGTHSPWISRLLAETGCEVIVANARKLRAIYQNERKCDKIDAQMLAKLARVDPSLLHPVQHISEQCQRDSLNLKLRDILVRQRVHIISSVRGVLKSLGHTTTCPSTPTFSAKAREALAEEADILQSVTPALTALDALSEQIKAYDKAITLAIHERYPAAQLLMSIAGIGPITALSFVLVVDDPSRFEDARDIGAFLGLVPRRDQSGDTDKALPISKTGNQALRRLLVQCAQYILGNFGPDSDLRRQGLKLAGKGGQAGDSKKDQSKARPGGKAAKRKAVVAVARKLAVVMLTMWKKQSKYIALREVTDTQPMAA